MVRAKKGRQAFVTGSLRWVLRILLYAWAVTVIFPMYWTIATSVKSSAQFMGGDIWGWPNVMYFSNYYKAWTEADMGVYMFNTLFVVVLTVVLFTVMCTTTAFILGKYEFRFVRFFENYYFLAMMIPGMLLLVPLYFQLDTVGGWLQTLVQTVLNNADIEFKITDSLVVLSIIYAVQSLPTPIFLLTGFVKSVDKSFLEAARIDGAGEFYVFSRVVLPFVKPIVLFEALARFMGTWNEYMTALTFLESENKYTLSVGIQRLIAKFGYQSDYGAVFAGLIISLLPILILYIMFQKTIQNGTDMSEGLK